MLRGVRRASVGGAPAAVVATAGVSSMALQAFRQVALLAGSLRRTPVRLQKVTPRSDADWAAFWHISSETYEAAKHAAAVSGHAGKKEVEFLCAKDVGNDHGRFDLIVSPSTRDWINRRDALCDIAGIPGSISPMLGTARWVPDDISFSSFVGKHPEWGPGRSWVFFRDHPVLQHRQFEDVLIQRVQIFGHCAIHAPVTQQHYLVALHTRGETEQTLDMPQWLRKHASNEILEGIVFGHGVVGTTVLGQILVADEVYKCPAFDVSHDCSTIPGKLQQYGPGLVGSWRVASDFSESSGPHLGAAPAEDPKKPDARHAMLVVGYRRTAQGQLRLLLQNWWREKQFVEVDEAYFYSCNTFFVTFVVTPQTHFPEAIDLTGDAFAVCAADGAGVSGVGEKAGGL